MSIRYLSWLYNAIALILIFIGGVWLSGVEEQTPLAITKGIVTIIMFCAVILLLLKGAMVK